MNINPYSKLPCCASKHTVYSRQHNSLYLFRMLSQFILQEKRNFVYFFSSIKSQKATFHELNIDNDNVTLVIYSVCLAQSLFYCFVGY